MQKLRKLLRTILLDLKPHKVKWVINTPSYLVGCFGTITRYGFELNQETWEVFVEIVSEKLSGTREVEYEFDEEEYNNLLALKDLPTFIKS